MSWQSFLNNFCKRQEYNLTSLEIEVMMCLQENQLQAKQQLLETYKQQYTYIEDEAFTQRLKSIYRKFQLNGREKKLPQLQKLLAQKYQEYKNKDIFFAEVGLNYIHSSFPNYIFHQQIDRIINSDNPAEKHLDILQTFAPNLHQYYQSLVDCLDHGIKVRILLAWPYSEAAKLREDVLKKYTDSSLPEEMNIQNCVIENLELLEKVIKRSQNHDLLEIRLYDCLPSLAMYRAGNYLLAGVFLHGILAVDTFQLELNLDASNQLIAKTLQTDFELVWQAARSFSPAPECNWRNDLKILFTL